MRYPLSVAIPLCALAACAAPNASLDSLRPRAAEAIDPRVPIPAAVMPGQPTASIAAEARRLHAQAMGSTGRFEALADAARNAARGAGAAQSERWIVAQQALSQAVAARAPVALALGGLDALTQRQVTTPPGISEADRLTIKAAAEEVAVLDARQAATIAEIQRMLTR